jgi:hypothetical protein
VLYSTDKKDKSQDKQDSEQRINYKEKTKEKKLVAAMCCKPEIRGSIPGLVFKIFYYYIITVSSVACQELQYFSILSHKRQDLPKEIILDEKCVL